MNETKSLLIYLCIAISSAMVLLILPVLVGGIDAKFTVSPGQLGMLAAADMLGAAVGALFLSSRMHQYSWRTIAIVSMSLLVTTNLASVFVNEWLVFMGLRFVAGLGAGGGLAIGNGGLATLSNADRNIGIYVVAALGIGAVALRVLSGVSDKGDIDIIFYFLAAAALIGLVASLFVDNTKQAETADKISPDTRLFSELYVVAGVAGILIFFIGIGATWGYMQKIGAEAGLDAKFIGNALGLGSLFGACGGLLSIFLATKFGRLHPVLIACFAAVLMLVVFKVVPMNITFMITVAAVLFVWNFSWPYMVGAMASIDPTARLVSLAASMQLFGFALAGPISGALIGESSYFVAILIGIAGFVLSALLLAKLLHNSDK